MTFVWDRNYNYVNLDKMGLLTRVGKESPTKWLTTFVDGQRVEIMADELDESIKSFQVFQGYECALLCSEGESDENFEIVWQPILAFGQNYNGGVMILPLGHEWFAISEYTLIRRIGDTAFQSSCDIWTNEQEFYDRLKNSRQGPTEDADD